MPVVIFLAAAVILGGVVVVAMGRGGELERSPRELASRLDFRTWSDVARYRPPAALLGYHAGATEHALAVIARTIAERDAEIDWLRRRLAETDPQLRPPVAASAEGSARVAAAGSADSRAPAVSGEDSRGEDDSAAQRPGAPGRHEFLASPTESPAEAAKPADDDAAAADFPAVVSATAGPGHAVVSGTGEVGDAAGPSDAVVVSGAAKAGGADEVGGVAGANGTAAEPEHLENVAAGAVSGAGPADGSPRDEGE